MLRRENSAPLRCLRRTEEQSNRRMKSQYFGVIGNRDYIKLRGERRPFWEFLDSQPDGWLSSISYKRKDLPHGKPMIWDCGAWSYRNKEVPDHSPSECVELYSECALPGSMVIAPDHMLIPGVDCAARRKINAAYAREFIAICPESLNPMATAHGETIDERIETAIALCEMGYHYIALGGLAAQASRKQMAVQIVSAIRQAAPQVHLHVLGLSSPEYARQWNQIGVQSFDGSSHFKQAFTGGAFYTCEGAKLIKHQAARPGNAEDLGIVAPECHCRACAVLREVGVDTRSFGSNEHNMGRAAHNMNMLMLAQQEAMRQPQVVESESPELAL